MAFRKKWWDKMINKRKKKFSNIVSISCYVLLLLAFAIGATDVSIPDSKTVIGTLAVSEQKSDVFHDGEFDNGIATVMGLPVKNVKVNVIPDLKLIPGGSYFGVKFFTKGVMIVGMSDVESVDGILNPAFKSGLRVGDSIIKMNGIDVNTVEDVASIVEKSGGEKIKIEYCREDEYGDTSLIPLKSLSDGKYRTGMWVRDSTAGIGTVTYYNPETGEFAGLGHGICDVDTGRLMPLLKGNIVDITVTDILKGSKGTPGEVKGEFGIVKNGELNINSNNGVFGVLNSRPQCASEEAMKIALSSEIKEGTAFIYNALDGITVKKYEIELTKIYRNDSENKNFIFSVKDKELLDKTGGIIQGMSGSPIVQDGKLVGAVTHVLVNDPTRGYGIFIENMLTEAEKNK